MNKIVNVNSATHQIIDILMTIYVNVKRDTLKMSKDKFVVLVFMIAELVLTIKVVFLAIPLYKFSSKIVNVSLDTLAKTKVVAHVTTLVLIAKIIKVAQHANI